MPRSRGRGWETAHVASPAGKTLRGGWDSGSGAGRGRWAHREAPLSGDVLQVAGQGPEGGSR